MTSDKSLKTHKKWEQRLRYYRECNFSDNDAKKDKHASIRSRFYAAGGWTDPDAKKDKDHLIRVAYYSVKDWTDFDWYVDSDLEIVKMGIASCSRFKDSTNLYKALGRVFEEKSYNYAIKQLKLALTVVPKAVLLRLSMKVLATDPRVNVVLQEILTSKT